MMELSNSNNFFHPQIDKTEIVFNNRIKLVNISKSFNNNPILENINIEIEKGSITGFYGFSGSGKSTLLAILLGIFKTKVSCVALSNLSTNDFMEMHRGEVSYAGPESFLFEGTIKENLLYGNSLSVNDEDITDESQLISNASCTTNCLAPIAKVLNDNFGIKSGLMTTIHAYTNDQALAETTHKDFRRGRSATQNIIPTSTGAAKAVGMVLPELNGKLDGMAMRVPVPDGSVVDLVVELEKNVSIEDVNNAVKKASENELKGILEYSSVPLVSTDILQNPHSSIYDASSTQLLDGNHIKVVCWYDNEWGYSNRIVDLVNMLVSKK